MTGTDLRSAIAEELGDRAPMPSVVPGVLAEGRRRERRRRRAGVGLAAAATLGIVTMAATTFGGDRAGPQAPPPPVADEPNGGPVTQTRGEFAEWSADRFDEILPERFSDVRTTEHNAYVTYVGGVRVMFNLNISYVDWKHSDVGPGGIDLSPTCDGVDGDSCTRSPSLNAIASHDTLDDGSPYAGMELVVSERSEVADEVALNFFGKQGESQIPLSDDEILDLAGSPEFESIWREYTAHPKWIFASTFAKAEPIEGNR